MALCSKWRHPSSSSQSSDVDSNIFILALTTALSFAQVKDFNEKERQIAQQNTGKLRIGKACWASFQHQLLHHKRLHVASRSSLKVLRPILLLAGRARVGVEARVRARYFCYRFFCVSFSYSTKASCTNRAASQSFMCFYSEGGWGWIMWLAHRVRCGTRGSVTLPLKLHLKRQTQSTIRFSFWPIRWLKQRNAASRHDGVREAKICPINLVEILISSFQKLSEGRT